MSGHEPEHGELDLLFLGSGNAFAANGRAFSSFLLNGRYLFDIGPTVLQQLRRSSTNSMDIDMVFISHFHADHFFGLPFLFLDYWREGRTKDLYIAGPPGIEERAEMLFEVAFPVMPNPVRAYRKRYIEVHDGMEAEAAGIQFTAAEVDHVPSLRSFSYRVTLNDHVLMYSGDAKLCDGLLRSAPGADILVLECCSGTDPVHLSDADVAIIRSKASPKAKTVLTHLDGPRSATRDGLYIASDLARFHF